MKVKPGYKQTEVGVIPEDWEVKPLGSFAQLKNGYSFKSSTYTALGNFNVVTIANVQDGFMDISECSRVGCLPRDIQPHHRLQLGDVLISMTGNVGRVCRVYASNCLLNQRVGKLAPSSVDATFLFLLLSQRRFLIAMSGKAKGGAQGNLSVSDIIDFQFPLPPTKAEQEAIAEVLSDADTLIESLKQLLAKKRQIRQGAMQELLTGKRRLPGFRGRWEKIGLGELFTFKNGLNKAKKHFGYGTPIVNYMDVFRSSRIYSTLLEGRVSLTIHEVKNFDVKKGDVLFTRTSETPNEIGTASVVLDEPRQTVFSGFLLRGRPKDKRLCDPFKAYCFRSEYVRAQIVSKASYTTRALTNGRLLSAVVLLVPDVEEQAAIAIILSDMDAEIAALEGKLTKARQLKQGLMQELLTGRIRLV